MSREMKQVVHKTRQNILVTRLRFMGDIILTTPVLQNLRRAFPDAHIGYLAEAPFQQMLQPHPWVDSVFALDRQKGSLQFKLIRELRRRKWDVAIDLFGNPRSALLTFLSGAAMRIGGDFRGRRHYYTHRVGDDGRPKSAIQFHLNYLQPLGMETLAVDPHIHVTGAENQQAREHLAGLGYDLHKPIVGLHCGATWPAKKWFPDRFAQLAQRLHRQAGMQIYLTTGPGEEELVNRVRAQSGLAMNEIKVLPLRQLAALLKNFSAFVCNDCGPLHLAPAVATPTIGIFGPGEPDIWFPYDPAHGHRLVYHQVDCSRCHRDFCEKMICMDAISVSDVYEQVCSVLGSR
jgi:lipopolysaccharide heptosyltransferase II